jgi:hypothetical protein
VARSLAIGLAIAISIGMGAEARAAEPVRVAFVSDAGGGSGKAQRAVAAQMAKVHAERPFGVVLVGGDNVHGKSFRRAVDRPYRALRERGVRLVPVLGNHDVEDGRAAGDAQLARFGATPRTQVALGPSARAFGLDTTYFMPGSRKLYGPALDGLRARELRWLDEALASSPEPLKIVWQHHPIHGSVRDGDLERTLELRTFVEPILAKHGVVLDLAGHYHHLARTRPLSGVTHIVSGGAGSDLVPAAPGAPFVKTATALQHHFLLLEIRDRTLSVEAIGADGTVLDRVKLRR